ncbi:GbsR/MarR family transcriptional regulator [Lentibacillus salinarum]|uniref:HTH-type transcriptional regulator n=1 Tax=Lentibacillus salinarum TaxID=446820 RepID=A0ABW3ZSH6_9BACI
MQESTNETETVTYQVINEFAKTIEMFGLSPSKARLFVYLYLQEQPKTLDEMSEALGKSKTSMSTSVRSLSDAGLVTLVWRKGVRKDLYEANSQLFKLFMSHYANQWINTTLHQREALEKIQQNLISCDTHAPKLLDNLNEIIAFHNQIESSFHHLK